MLNDMRQAIFGIFFIFFFNVLPQYLKIAAQILLLDQATQGEITQLAMSIATCFAVIALVAYDAYQIQQLYGSHVEPEIRFWGAVDKQEFHVDKLMEYFRKVSVVLACAYLLLCLWFVWTLVWRTR